MMLFDIHCHLDDTAFDDDRTALLDSLPELGIKRLCWAGTNPETCAMALEYARKYPYIYCACGYYPHETDKMDDAGMIALEKMLSDDKCVALGECGLDYHFDDVAPEVQKVALARQAELAARINKPMVIHERDACADMLALLRECRVHNGVLHCFSGSVETARELLDMGLYISFSGTLTFKNARHAPDVARFVPRDRAVIETDSPYMAPVPFRGSRNTPDRTSLVAERLGELWGVTADQAAETTYFNACRLFNIQEK